jgi:predicted unusual protein kinase regulating ubiquinone biosynthesis (AarF/ABC1/UbiB family)
MILDFIRIILVIFKFFTLKILNYFNIVSNNYFYDNIIKCIQNEGIAFIKFAQGLGSRKDMKKYIPYELLNKIRDLQDKCFVDNNLNLIKFDLLEKNAIAAGSIASIYLINYNNKKSILKRKNDNIDKLMKKSKESLKLFLKIIAIFTKYNFFNNFDFNDYFSFLKFQTFMDLEAVNQLKFIRIFKKYDNIIIPQVHYFNRENLVMEYQPGLKLNEIAVKFPEFEFEAMSIIYAAMIVMVQNKVLHGDLHYGNFSFKIIDDSIKLIILDFGVICEFTNEQSNYLLNLINPKNNKKIKNENGILFVKSLDIDTTNIDIEGKKFDEILEIIFKSNAKINYNIFSCLTTLQVILSNTSYFRKKNPSFTKYLLGYLLENDYL